MSAIDRIKQLLSLESQSIANWGPDKYKRKHLSLNSLDDVETILHELSVNFISHHVTKRTKLGYEVHTFRQLFPQGSPFYLSVIHHYKDRSLYIAELFLPQKNGITLHSMVSSECASAVTLLNQRKQIDDSYVHYRTLVTSGFFFSGSHEKKSKISSMRKSLLSNTGKKMKTMKEKIANAEKQYKLWNRTRSIFKEKYKISTNPDYRDLLYRSIRVEYLRKPSNYMAGRKLVHANSEDIQIVYDKTSGLVIAQGDLRKRENSVNISEKLDECRKLIRKERKISQRYNIDYAVDNYQPLEAMFNTMKTKKLVPRSEYVPPQRKKIRSIKAMRKAAREKKRKDAHFILSRRRAYLLRKALCHDQWVLICPRSVFHGKMMKNIFIKYKKDCETTDYCEVRRVVKDIPLSSLNKMIANDTGDNINSKEALLLIKQLQLDDKMRSMSNYGEYELFGNAVSVDGDFGVNTKCITVVIGSIVELFLENPHIIYLDACHNSDGTKCALCVFRDMNGHVQPMAFSLFDQESLITWNCVLGCLQHAGINTVKDLVFICDHCESITKAIESYFPNAEIGYCSVHTERNITTKWQSVYGNLLRKDELHVNTFNNIIKYYNKARVAVNYEEWRGYMDNIKDIELQFRNHMGIMNKEKDDGNEKDNILPVYNKIMSLKGIWMYEFSYPHFKEDTSNPVEVCNNVMNQKQGFPHSIRTAPLFSRYRQLIEWSFRRIEERKRLLMPSGVKIPVMNSDDTPVYSPYTIKILMKHLHKYLCNQDLYEVKSAHENKEIVDPHNYQFVVADKMNGEKFRVNLKTGDCNCHYGYWKKIPCEHIMIVLFLRKEVNNAFKYVDYQYREGEVAKTCRDLKTDEIEFLRWLLSLKRENVGDDHIKVPVWVDTKGGRKGTNQNSARVASTGELISDEKDLKTGI